MGDAACWLDEVCDACGAVPDDGACRCGPGARHEGAAPGGRPPVEQLAWAETPRGVINLRRRFDPTLGRDVHEVKLGDEFLMSSLFTVAEEELARLGLAAHDGDDLTVVVGGLGLGCTARTALADERVAELLVVEALPEVVAWHEQHLLPGAVELVDDPRTRLVTGDFFAMARADGFDPDAPGRVVDVVLLDVDHTPDHVLHDSHAPFYTVEGLRGLRGLLAPDGVFALWSDDPPEERFLAALDEAFEVTQARVVRFPNPLTGGEASNTVYVAR